MEVRRIFVGVKKFQIAFTGQYGIKDGFQNLYDSNSGSFSKSQEAKKTNRYLHWKLGPMYAIAHMIHYHPR